MVGGNAGVWIIVCIDWFIGTRLSLLCSMFLQWVLLKCQFH